ncbi:hypothetical protein [Silvibacterium dinghuense]|uniref:hypothetical protein n=1 Tax=Silvibacterium dinghuense TaxID=1560006 RepID=UPI00403291AF
MNHSSAFAPVECRSASLIVCVDGESGSTCFLKHKLVEHFVARSSKKTRKKIRHILKQRLNEMKPYAWPENIRELQNVLVLRS